MSLRLSDPFGDRLIHLTATALGLSEADGTVDPLELEHSREAAFETSSDPASFAMNYLRSEALSKYDNGDPAAILQLERLAFQDFLWNERRCGQVNDRLSDVWIRSSTSTSVWRRARRIIAGVLGRFPWEEFPRACGFGPGASTSLPRRSASPQNKWGLSSHITEGALPYHQAFAKWTGSVDVPTDMSVVDGNKVTTVPKSWNKRRIIAIEPDWNMFYQKGVGRLIRSRLQRRGLLTPRAQENSRAMACMGSITGNLATLDLSAASDSVTLSLCEALLPMDWMEVLLGLRSPVGFLPTGETVTYEKISSMGNGFTFELETLLFYALTAACCDKGESAITVYGDDIICPVDRAPEVAEVLLEAGFFINVDKSFFSGPFRESCGGHYWKGSDVTPFYVKRPPRHLADVVVLHNAVMAWCMVDPRNRDTEYLEHLRATCRSRVPRKFWGPYGLDGVLWSEWDAVRPTWKRDTQSYTGWRLVGEVDYRGHYDSVGALLSQLWTENREWEANEEVWAVKNRIKPSRYFHDRYQYIRLPVR